MKTTKFLGMLIAFFALTVLTGCSNDDDDEKILTMYVSAETGVYYGMTGVEEGLLVRTSPSEDWYAMSMEGIDDFDYEKGYAYKLLVGKNIVENPPQDGSSIIYRLVEIQERKQIISYDLPENFSLDDLSFQAGCPTDIYEVLNPTMTINTYGAFNYNGWIFLDYALKEGEEFYQQRAYMAAYALVVDEKEAVWLTNVGSLGVPIKGVLSKESLEMLMENNPGRELTYRIVLMNNAGLAIQNLSVTFKKG